MTQDQLELILASDLAEQIWASNEFLQYAINDDANVSAGKVRLFQSGASPTTQKNRTVYPLPVADRADTFIDYDINEYSTDATRIAYSEKALLSYDKNGSILASHQRKLADNVAKDILMSWAKNATICRTSGIVDTSAPIGTRKPLTLLDIALLRKKKRELGVPDDGDAYLLLSPQHLLDLSSETSLFNSLFVGGANLGSGNIVRAHGFNIITRQTVLYLKDGVNQKPYTDLQAGDAASDASLFWHRGFVRRAQGDTQVFIDVNSSVYQGDVISALTRCGGSPFYADSRGIAVIADGKK
jgi:hypothetical protein